MRSLALFALLAVSIASVFGCSSGSSGKHRGGGQLGSGSDSGDEAGSEVATPISIRVVATLNDGGTCPGALASSGAVTNGDFCMGATGWQAYSVLSGVGDYPHVGVSSQPACNAVPTGNPFLYLDVPEGSDGYAEQSVMLPASATLTFLTWGNLNPVSETVSIVDASGVHVLESFTPPSVQANGGGACSGQTPLMKSYSLAPYSGMVRVRFEATSMGMNGTICNVDNVVIQ